jgi:site-specific DNA recombinase
MAKTLPQTTPRAVLYVRVSSMGQALDGDSLEAQAERLAAYCKVRGLVVVETVQDPAQSAYKPLANRKGGRRVLELVKARSVDVVVVYKLDRAFRNARDCLDVTSAWDKAGVALHLVDLGGQAVDTRSATGRFFLTIMAGAAELERNQVAERTAMVLRMKARKGERIGCDAPFGFAHENGRLIENAPEQATLATVRALRAAGVSFRGVCAQLETKGIRNRAGGSFAPVQIERMMRGPSRPLRAA